MKGFLLLFSALAIQTICWESGMGSKQKQEAVNQAFRINTQLNEWENSHILPKPISQSLKPNPSNTQPNPNPSNQTNQGFQEPQKHPGSEILNEVDAEKIAKIRRDIFEEKKKFAQEWVNKKNNEANQEIRYFVNSMGKVDFIVNKKKEQQNFDKNQQTMEM